ncbi:MAG TPA: SDR family NAD(P)-dependent oxidoreductase, partial [Desulfosarcina sp.]|nr:SDR family NAD(P)-dependent oxidoreductase [Desulfosarcina sp.]
MSLELFSLKGKVAMVTGSSKGLGEVAATALAKAGADVAVCGRNRADIDRVVEKPHCSGGRAAGFVLEVSSSETVQQGVDAILAHFGR